jgi:hypothetical protein
MISCSSSTITASQWDVDRFHRMFNAGQYSEIYSSSSFELKGSTTETAFLTVMMMNKKKLGSVLASEMRNREELYTTKGHYVLLTYNTRFTKMTAVEKFLVLPNTNEFALAGYGVTFDGFY